HTVASSRSLHDRLPIYPYKGKWALPGGIVGEKENLYDAALRELKEETNVSNVYLEQLYTFGEPGRDPRARVITVAYFALLSAERSEEHTSELQSRDKLV